MRAGVSHQTVSRVLNEHMSVRPETRRRVLEAIDELGYRRNSAARALATRRSQTLGVISFDTTLFGPASTLYGIEGAARDAGYYVSIASTKTMTRETVLEGMERLAGQSVAGFVIIAPQREAYEAVADLPHDVPVVMVEGRSASWAPVVSVDHVAGGRLATRHLLEQGARCVWHVGGPVDWLEAEGREEGWRAALTEAGLAAPELLRGDWTAGSGYHAGQRLAVDPEVDAVFVGNDQMALGVLLALHEHGRPVPGDVLVAGFDDVPEAAYFLPPLTTVRQDFIAVGRRCIELLVARIEGEPDESFRAVVLPELVIRQSTSRPDRSRLGRSAGSG